MRAICRSACIEKLVAIDGLEDIGLTTNGILLADQADARVTAERRADADRLSASTRLDARSLPATDAPEPGLEQVIDGILGSSSEPDSIP